MVNLKLRDGDKESGGQNEMAFNSTRQIDPKLNKMRYYEISVL